MKARIVPAAGLNGTREVTVSYPERASGTASLAVGSTDMKRHRSTLATTAIAAFGLLVAAHVLHPGNYERSERLLGSV
jgi:hypothetical protein